MPYKESERAAQAAYDSQDAGTFYSHIWGGDDIHLGIYNSVDEPIADASHRTMQHMVDKITQESIDSVIDLGSGYCGAARFLHRELDTHVLAVNLSSEQNRRARQLNELAGLAEPITVVDASYNAVPANDVVADLVWSQDAFLHASNRKQPLAEAARVLKPGGEFLFTDPMAADGVNAAELSGVLERLNLSSLASPSEYQQLATEVGFEVVEFDDLSQYLPLHYGRVLKETQTNADNLLVLQSHLFWWVSAVSSDIAEMSC
ncbi:MAG TPA: methyltransferase domain-containing protein [Yaniella sp.]